MSKAICIMGEPGSGKTTSMRNLPSDKTIYIDCDGKGLPWKNWKKQYNSENKNYIKTDWASKVEKYMAIIDQKKDWAHIKYIVIDTLNGIMIADEKRRAKEKSYDKWADLAWAVLDIVQKANLLREDLTVILIAHSQTDRDESGYYWTRLKTSGKKLDKISLESKLNTVLLAKCIDGNYVFETHSNNSTARTPMGAFETDTIENDIMLVLKALEEY